MVQSQGGWTVVLVVPFVRRAETQCLWDIGRAVVAQGGASSDQTLPPTGMTAVNLEPRED